MSKVRHKEEESQSQGASSGAQHVFNRQNNENLTVIPTLRRIGQLMSGDIRLLIEPIGNARIRVEAIEPEIATWESWADRQAELLSISMFQLPPMRGRVMMKLEVNMLNALVDAFFGGSLSSFAPKKKELGRSDVQMAERIAKGIEKSLTSTWSDYGKFRCQMDEHGDSLAGLRFAAPLERIVIQRFRLNCPEKTFFEIELIYTLDSLQSIAPMLETEADEVQTDPMWREQIGDALGDVYLQARSVLARPTLTLPQLAELKVGDIINIPPARNLPLIIEDRVFARGNIGEQNGLAAFKITHIEQKG